jgi:uncharacterized protein (TIGR00255 family)
MTGYGRGEASSDMRTALAEIRAVNHRYCEVYIRIPNRYGFAEEPLRQMVKQCAGRGKIDVAIGFTSAAEEDALVIINTAVAKQYYQGLLELQQTFNATGDISIDLLASMPDVLCQDRPQSDDDKILSLILQAAHVALAAFDEMRDSEGAKLKEDLGQRLDNIAEIAKIIETRAPEVRKIYAEKLKDRIASLVNKSIDVATLEQRLALEIMIFADKSSIEEEIVRLFSHIDQFRKTIRNTDNHTLIGKKLDFIVQEMNREANTIGSKANDLRITDLIIALKSDIENIREQIQNIA